MLTESNFLPIPGTYDWRRAKGTWLAKLRDEKGDQESGTLALEPSGSASPGHLE